MVLGQIKLTFYAVAGAVVQHVLEMLGHTVEVKEGFHEELYPMLGKGEIDLLAASWLPEAHATYWNQYKDQAIQLVILYKGAHLFWGVPGYVPETAVKSVEDLVKPEVLDKMTKVIQGIGPGSGLMIGSMILILSAKNAKPVLSIANGKRRVVESFVHFVPSLLLCNFT